MPRYFEDPELEDRLNAVYNRPRSTDLETGRIAAANKKAYPWLKPGAAGGLGKARVAPGSPTGMKAAKAAGKVKAKTLWAELGDVVKAGARTAFTALETPVQEVQGQLRALTHASDVASRGDDLLDFDIGKFTRTLAKGSARQLGRSTGALALKNLAAGERVDLGQGWFSGGDIRKDHGEYVKGTHAPMFKGQAISTGRTLSYLVTEPGTKAHKALSGLLDAGFALGADPAAAGLGVASKARKASKLFEAGGVVDKVRRTTAPDKVTRWLDGEGTKVINYLAETKSFDEIWRRTGKKIDVKTVAALTDADTPAAVRAILAPELGVSIRQKPTVATFRKTAGGIRLAKAMPGRHIDLDDVNDAVEQVDRFASNAKLAPEAIASFTEAMARTDTRIARFKVVEDLLSSTNGVLVQEGLKPQRAKKLTRMFTDYHEEMRKYFVDEIGNHAPVPGAVIDGTGYALPTPHLFVEYVNRTVPLPDAREIRRMTSGLKGLWTTPGVGKFMAGSVALGDAFMQQAWKPLALLRFAWPVRVIGEEQVRMGGSGLDSLVAHPMSAIAWITGRKGAGDIKGDVFKDASEAAADLDDFAKAMSRGSMGFRDPANVIRTKNKVLYRKDDEHYVSSWADELMQLRTDPVGEKVAQGLDNVDEVKGWFYSGPGQKFRKEMSAASGRAELLSRQGSDEYIDTVLKRIHIKTGGDRRLIDAIGTGMIEQTPVRDVVGSSKGFRQTLESMIDVGPEAVKGDQILTRKGNYAGWDKAVETMFNSLMSKPTNYLSRSSAFRQYYWQHARELMPFMDAKAQYKTISAANKANMAPGAVDKLRKASRGSGALSLDEADALAKGFALDSTRNLLYDLTDRSQLFDITRLIFPFGEAWKEVLTRWAKIGVQNPQVARRFQQTVEGARGSGFFHEDQFGEEVFSYPGSKLLTEKLLDVPVELKGSVKGLNIAGQLHPGFGPLVQVPASWFLPDTPNADSIRKALLPFGETDTSGGILESFAPAWMKKFMAAAGKPAQQRSYNNTVMDIASYLSSTGKYNTNSEDGIRDLMDDAKAKAQGMFIIRGFASFMAPSAPTPAFYAKDKSGNLVYAHKLAEDFRKMQTEDYDTSVTRFLDKYGDDALLFTQPKTVAVTPGLPVTEQGSQWTRANKDFVDRYPDVYGFFAPEGGEFDTTAYLRQIASGERKALAPEQAVRQANNRIANQIYAQAKAKVGDSDEEKAWLRELKDALLDDYPGFTEKVVERKDTKLIIRQLAEAAKDAKVSATPAAQGLKVYLDGRDKALAMANEDGLAGFQKAKGARYIRDWLRELADSLASEYPGFSLMWERALIREFPSNEETEEE